MSDVNKVYIVTEGEYSDYHICAVFATRAEAETYCAVHDGDAFNDFIVNEFAVSEIDAKPVKYVYKAEYFGRPKPIVTLRYVTSETVETNFCERCRRNAWRREDRCNIIDCSDHPGRMVVLPKRNERKAIKIVQDRIAKAKAEREGL